MSLTEDATGSLESPTMVSVNGGTPVMAIVEHLSLKECRLRAVAAFEPGASIAFDFTAYGVAKAHVRGRIASSAENGARRSYAVVIDTSDPAAADALAIAVDAARRHAGSKAAPDVPAPNGLTRASVRVPVNLEVRYRIAGAPERSARATNISVGGMLMNCADVIAVGSTIDLHFTLPNVGPLVATARIVAHQDASPNYNCAFFGLNDETKRALARFVDASTTA